MSSIEVTKRYRASSKGKEAARKYANAYYHRVTKYNPTVVAKRRKANIVNHYKKQYGLTVDEATKMKQRGCDICGAKLGMELCIDHDHSTGHVRGVLCHHCNLAVGYYEKLATKIAVYLEK